MIAFKNFFVKLLAVKVKAFNKDSFESFISNFFSGRVQSFYYTVRIENDCLPRFESKLQIVEFRVFESPQNRSRQGYFIGSFLNTVYKYWLKGPGI